MKRKSLISLGLAGTMLLSMYGTALANTTSGVYNAGGTSGYFNWTWIDYDKTLEFSKSSSTWGSTNSFQDYYHTAEKIVIKDTNNYSSYTFGGAPTFMESVESLYIYNNCSKVEDIRLFENLETITISSNQYTYDDVILDMSSANFETLPEISITGSSSDLSVYADLTDYYNDFLTVPACYGEDEDVLYYSFEDSEDLFEVSFESGTKVIPCSAFEDCENLHTVTIPDGVTLIEYNAFDGCGSLSSISIPSSVTEIKSDAFDNSGIEWIDFGGTVDDWFGLVQDLDSDGDPIEGATVLHLNDVMVYCSDGNVYIKEDGNDYCQYVEGWHKEGGKWRYYEYGDYCTDQFIDEDGDIYYVDGNGYMATGWKKISNDWYYFASGGKMTTGWKKIGGSYYLFDEEGVMQTGWVKDGSKWYYLDSNGKMATGWQKISNKWYYFQSSGAMATGWQKISNKWYYFQSSGAMKTGWLKSGSNWYYLDSDGAMLSNCSRKISGKTYNFNASGVCTNP